MKVLEIFWRGPYFRPNVWTYRPRIRNLRIGTYIRNFRALSAKAAKI
jgi:hypothetical protein